MRYLLPLGGKFDRRFKGVLTSYKHRGVPASIKAGHPWAGDNCAFSGFDAAEFRGWLRKVAPYRATCLFIVVPDAVADARRTLELWDEWAPQLTDWPLALVAQDGMEGLEWPTNEDFGEYYYRLCNDDAPTIDEDKDEDTEPYWASEYGWQAANANYWRDCTPWTTLFIGGSTRWKLSTAAADLIADAQHMGKHIHVGRVNWEKRYRHFARLPDSESFTCDGTRTRSEGRTRTLHAWANYQANLPNYRSQLAMLGN